MRIRFFPLFIFLTAAAYWTLISYQSDVSEKLTESLPEVVVPAPIQVLLYAGDRFLAGNMELIRASSISSVNDSQLYRLRSHISVSKLHPCHEDNYWLGNASLSWGGAADKGLELMGRATQCRFWDEWPAFFYGFNQNFFFQNDAVTKQMMEVAANRSPQNKAVFKTYATMLAVDKIDSLGMAVDMLEIERDKAVDEDLRKSLAMRVLRLRGLKTLREAQTSYEKKLGKPLEQPKALLDAGILQSFPKDPMRIGYEFRDHTFHLKQIQFQ